MLKKILWQSAFLLVIGMLAGLTVNALSQKPLDLIRQPESEIKEKWNAVTAEQVLEYTQSGAAIIIDARDTTEFEAGHIQGALNLPVNHFEKNLDIVDALPREGFPIVVYCQGGDCDQSHDLLEKLESMGFQDLHIYEGGWNKWEAQGYPTASGQ